MTKAVNSLLGYEIQRAIPNAEQVAANLLYNPTNSMAHRITRIQKGVDFKDIQNNMLIQALRPNINPNVTNVLDKISQNNVFLNNANRLSVDEMNNLTDAWLELHSQHPDISRDLIYTSLFQSGINRTYNSLTAVIPEVLMRELFGNVRIATDNDYSDAVTKVRLRNVMDKVIVKKFGDPNVGKSFDYSAGLIS